MTRIYTRKGDDGTTSLWYGGRVAKTDARTEAYGSIDEAGAALGVARSLCGPDDDELAADILRLQRELFVAGAELATAPEAEGRLQEGISRIDDEMVDALEPVIDRYMDRVDLPPKFVISGGTTPLGAARHGQDRDPPSRAPRGCPDGRRASSRPRPCCATSIGLPTSSSRWRGSRTSTTPSCSRAGTLVTGMVKVTARRRQGFTHDVEVQGGHRMVIDEPEVSGGGNEGPSPTRTLAAALAACTAITIEMYADRKGWDVGALQVDVEMEYGEHERATVVRGDRARACRPHRGAGRAPANDRRQVPRPPPAVL